MPQLKRSTCACAVHAHTRALDRAGPPPPLLRRCAPSQPSSPASTNPSLAPAVDIWSGNHPFFQGNQGTVVTDEGRVNRFKRRFEGLSSLSTVETISGQREAKKAADAAAAKK